MLATLGGAFMLKNYKLLLIIVVCFMFPIACNEMHTKLSVSGVGKASVGITTMCTKLAASGEDEVYVCTCDKRNKPFCLTPTILIPELIGHALNYFCVEKFRRIMRYIFQKKRPNHCFKNIRCTRSLWMITQKKE